MVFINGLNLGRYWSIGPQQTLYLPGPFLNSGINQVQIVIYICFFAFCCGVMCFVVLVAFTCMLCQTVLDIQSVTPRKAFWTPDSNQQTFPGWTWRSGTGPFPLPTNGQNWTKVHNKTDEMQSAIRQLQISKMVENVAMICSDGQTDSMGFSVLTWLL